MSLIVGLKVLGLVLEDLKGEYQDMISVVWLLYKPHFLPCLCLLSFICVLESFRFNF